MTLNHKDLMAAIAAKADLPTSRIEVVYAALQAVIHDQISAGNDVKLNNIATIKMKAQAERSARNPATSEVILVPAKNVLKVTLAKALKDATPGLESN